MPKGFPPLAAPGARVLVLGSLPGRRSLEAYEYYAQPQNTFWRMMGALFCAAPALPYHERVARLTSCGVAVWDVLAAAERPGSLDSAIVRSTMRVNDFAPFFAAQPGLCVVAFNGTTAAELYRRRVLPQLEGPAAALERIVLPSTSPAHATLRFEEKLRRWTTLKTLANAGSADARRARRSRG
jgi:double-stranded uracil-DNA glycosylase